MMEIVIKIDEEDYKTIKSNYENGFTYKPFEIIANGTPLPSHHGRIIDESKIESFYYHIENSENKRFRIEHTVIDGTDAPTIIEADKEG